MQEPARNKQGQVRICPLTAAPSPRKVSPKHDLPCMCPLTNNNDNNNAQRQTLYWQVAKAAGSQMVCGPQNALCQGYLSASGFGGQVVVR